jgi:hypothetical protein
VVIESPQILSLGFANTTTWSGDIREGAHSHQMLKVGWRAAADVTAIQMNVVHG